MPSFSGVREEFGFDSAFQRERPWILGAMHGFLVLIAVRFATVGKLRVSDCLLGRQIHAALGAFYRGLGYFFVRFTGRRFNLLLLF